MTLNTDVFVHIYDASTAEKGFFHATATWGHANATITKGTAFGDGPARAVAFALEDLAREIKKTNPRQPDGYDAVGTAKR